MSALRSFLLLRRTIQVINAAMRPSAATPPTTPPAIAPTLVDEPPEVSFVVISELLTAPLLLFEEVPAATSSSSSLLLADAFPVSVAIAEVSVFVNVGIGEPDCVEATISLKPCPYKV